MAERDLQDLEQYFRTIGRQQLAPKYRAKFDTCDVVQEAMVAVYAEWSRIQQMPDAEMFPYLHAILKNRIRDEIRKWNRDVRNVDREVRLRRSADESSQSLEGWIRARQPSPSSAAILCEERLHYAQSLGTLPADQRLALELRYLDGLSTVQAAQEMGRTEASVAGLVRRGLKALRQQLT